MRIELSVSQFQPAKFASHSLIYPYTLYIRGRISSSTQTVTVQASIAVQCWRVDIDHKVRTLFSPKHRFMLLSNLLSVLHYE